MKVLTQREVRALHVVQRAAAAVAAVAFVWAVAAGNTLVTVAAAAAVTGAAINEWALRRDG